MNRRQFTLGAASTAAFASAGDALAQQCSNGKVGELRDVNAWVDKMPPARGGRLFITGRIVTPTPCYDATVKFVGEKKSNPPIGMFKVSVKQRPGICIQCIAEVSFRYEDRKYAGKYETIEVSSDQDTKTVKVQVVS
jgi:hypothetical protein